jgi:hypothetical protein
VILGTVSGVRSTFLAVMVVGLIAAFGVPVTLAGNGAARWAEVGLDGARVAGARGAESWAVELVVDADDGNVVAVAGGLTLAGADAGSASAAASGGEVDSAVGGNEVDAGREGVLIGAAHRLRGAAVVTAEVEAERPAGTGVEVDVRGGSGDGRWGEWRAVPSSFDDGPVMVQVRVTLYGGAGGVAPVVRAVRVTAQYAELSRAPRTAEPLSYQVFATREGLVGATTANGHVISERDHFVALPSRRGLSRRGQGEYSVRVCAANGRCAWAPVWDVGPWNIRDDYWNPGGLRQMWADLPQGRPQAQAANRDGYNGGLDQFQRQVRNPAGIDLADGTFWDALKLRDNAWVTVTYLWNGNGGQVTGTVDTPGDALNVRDGPNTDHAPTGLAGNRARVNVECQVTGLEVTGSQGTTDRWLRISPGGYVSGAWVDLDGDPATIPTCG